MALLLVACGDPVAEPSATSLEPVTATTEASVAATAPVQTVPTATEAPLTPSRVDRGFVEGDALVAPPSTVTASVETEIWPGALGDVADDMAIYYHEADPEASFILAVSKSDASDGGIHTFDMGGALIDSWLIGKINGVEIRDLATYDNVADEWADRVLVLATNRTEDEITYAWLNRSTGELTGAGTTSLAFEPYGCSLYVSPVEGTVYAFVSEATSGNNRLRQYELSISGDAVSGVQVRSLDTATLSEGMSVYESSELFFLGEEDLGLYVYDAEPDGGTSRTAIDTVSGGNLTADVEGVAVIHPTGSQPGFILASSQGAGDFQLYELESPHSYVGTFVVGAGAADSAQNTDGIDVLRMPFGVTWPNGVLAVHDDTNTGGGASNVKLVDLGELLGPIATAR